MMRVYVYLLGVKAVPVRSSCAVKTEFSSSIFVFVSIAFVSPLNGSEVFRAFNCNLITRNPVDVVVKYKTMVGKASYNPLIKSQTLVSLCS